MVERLFEASTLRRHSISQDRCRRRSADGVRWNASSRPPPYGCTAFHRIDAGDDPPMGFGGTPLRGFHPTDAPHFTGQMPVAIRRWGSVERLFEASTLRRHRTSKRRCRRRSADGVRWNASSSLPPSGCTAFHRTDAGGDPPVGFGGTPFGLPPYGPLTPHPSPLTPHPSPGTQHPRKKAPEGALDSGCWIAALSPCNPATRGCLPR